MSLRPGIALAILLLATGCAGRRPAPATPAWDRARSEREVWIAALREVSDGRTPSRYVVTPEAGRGDPSNAQALAGLRGDTLADFSARPKEGRLPADLDPGAPIAWFGRSDWEALPEEPADTGSVEGRWTTFRQRFPGTPGWTTLSQVGFSADGRQALLYVANSSASLSGWGELWLLERIPTGWRLVQRAAIWIS